MPESAANRAEAGPGGATSWPRTYEPVSASTRATPPSRDSDLAKPSTSAFRLASVTGASAATTESAEASCDEKLPRIRSWTWRLDAVCGKTRSSGSPKLTRRNGAPRRSKSRTMPC